MTEGGGDGKGKDCSDDGVSVPAPGSVVGASVRFPIRVGDSVTLDDDPVVGKLVAQVGSGVGCLVGSRVSAADGTGDGMGVSGLPEIGLTKTFLSSGPSECRLRIIVSVSSSSRSPGQLRNRGFVMSPSRRFNVLSTLSPLHDPKASKSR